MKNTENKLNAAWEDYDSQHIRWTRLKTAYVETANKIDSLTVEIENLKDARQKILQRQITESVDPAKELKANRDALSTVESDIEDLQISKSLLSKEFPETIKSLKTAHEYLLGEISQEAANRRDAALKEFSEMFEPHFRRLLPILRASTWNYYPAWQDLLKQLGLSALLDIDLRDAIPAELRKPYLDVPSLI